MKKETSRRLGSSRAEVHAKASRRRFAPPSRPPPVRLPRAASPRERRSFFSAGATRRPSAARSRAQHVRAAGDGGGRVRLRADAHLGIRRPHLRMASAVRITPSMPAISAPKVGSSSSGSGAVRARGRDVRGSSSSSSRASLALSSTEFPPRVAGSPTRPTRPPPSARQRRLVALRLFQPQTQSLHRRVGRSVGPGRPAPRASSPEHGIPRRRARPAREPSRAREREPVREPSPPSPRRRARRPATPPRRGRAGRPAPPPWRRW